MAVELYEECERLKIPNYLKTQLLRASSSVVLNLAEGSTKSSVKDRRKFYSYSLGSLREVQAILYLKKITYLADKLDHLGACLYNTRVRVNGSNIL